MDSGKPTEKMTVEETSEETRGLNKCGQREGKRERERERLGREGRPLPSPPEAAELLERFDPYRESAEAWQSLSDSPLDSLLDPDDRETSEILRACLEPTASDSTRSTICNCACKNEINGGDSTSNDRKNCNCDVSTDSVMAAADFLIRRRDEEGDQSLDLFVSDFKIVVNNPPTKKYLSANPGFIRALKELEIREIEGDNFVEIKSSSMEEVNEELSSDEILPSSLSDTGLVSSHGNPHFYISRLYPIFFRAKWFLDGISRSTKKLVRVLWRRNDLKKVCLEKGGLEKDESVGIEWRHGEDGIMGLPSLVLSISASFLLARFDVLC